MEDNQIESQKIQSDDTEITTILRLKESRVQVYRKFAQVCTELKLLYVAITRPKNVLIIYDDDIEERKSIQDYWRKIDAVTFVDRKLMSNLTLLPQNAKTVLRIDENPA